MSKTPLGDFCFNITDDEISSMFSNIMVIYSKYFKKQKFKVLTPKAKLFESMPVTPVSLMTATMLYIVDKPFQIEVNRLFNFGEDQERIRLI